MIMNVARMYAVGENMAAEDRAAYDMLVTALKQNIAKKRLEGQSQ